MVKNIDPTGDAILQRSMLSLLDGLRAAIERDDLSWREYPSNRFGSLYVRLTQRYIMPKGCRKPVQVKTIELASVSIQPMYRGRGAFRAILAELKSIANKSGRVLYIENVINYLLLRKLQHYPELQRLRQFDGASAPCFVYIPK